MCTKILQIFLIYKVSKVRRNPDPKLNKPEILNSKDCHVLVNNYPERMLLNPEFLKRFYIILNKLTI